MLRAMIDDVGTDGKLMEGHDLTMMMMPMMTMRMTTMVTMICWRNLWKVMR